MPKGGGRVASMNNLAPRNRIYQSYEETKALVQPLGFKNQSEYRRWAKSTNKPDDS